MPTMPTEAWEGAREWFQDSTGTYFWTDQTGTVQSRPYSPAEAAEALARANGTTIEVRVAQAIQDNKDFVALAAPTNAQTVAQVKALTRQVNGLLRTVFRRLDAAD